MSVVAESTESQILNSAREVFIAKGLDGARMQEIADHAGINKALLHYYFRTKEKLFEAVFTEVAANLFPAIKQVLSAELAIKEKITFFVKVYLTGIRENPFIPSFVINTLNSNPDRFLKLIVKTGIDPRMLQKQIDAEAAQGLIRPVKVEHLVVNIIAMCIFPFVARPIVQNIFDMNDGDYQQYLETRQNEITDFVLKSLTV